MSQRNRWGCELSQEEKLKKAVEELCDSLQMMPEKGLRKELSKIKIGSPKSIAHLQDVLNYYTQDDYGRKLVFKAEEDAAKDAECRKILDVIERTKDAVNDLLNVEGAETLDELNFQVACVEAGCFPASFRGRFFLAYDDLQKKNL